ncbi:hypothetical protein D3C79_880740 [compost metagenome]
MGSSAWPKLCSTTALKRSSGSGLSFQWLCRAPGGICSKPTASTQSAAPLAMALRARYRAVEPEEQLLLTLMMGTPVMPTSYTARWPLVESP